MLPDSGAVSHSRRSTGHGTFAGPWRVVERVLDQLQTPFLLDGQPVLTRASVGVVLSRSDRQADSVQRQRIKLRNVGKRAVRHAAKFSRASSRFPGQ